MKFVYSMEDVSKLVSSGDIKYAVNEVFKNICENAAGISSLYGFNMERYGTIAVLDDAIELKNALEIRTIGKYHDLNIHSVVKGVFEENEVYCITFANKEHLVECIFEEELFEQCDEENKDIISSKIKRVRKAPSDVKVCCTTKVDLTEKKEMSKTEMQHKLIEKYEEKLRKVKIAYSDSWKGEKHIKFAEEELEAVKNGREW